MNIFRKYRILWTVIVIIASLALILTSFLPLLSGF